MINGWLKEMGVGDMPDGGLYEEAFANLSAESVYGILADDLRRDLWRDETGRRILDMMSGYQDALAELRDQDPWIVLDIFYKYQQVQENATISGAFRIPGEILSLPQVKIRKDSPVRLTLFIQILIWVHDVDLQRAGLLKNASLRYGIYPFPVLISVDWSRVLWYYRRNGYICLANQD